MVAGAPTTATLPFAEVGGTEVGLWEITAGTSRDIEVDEVFEVPLAFALEPSNLQVHGRRWQGGWRQYYVIPYGPHYIWGATARMLKTLGDRMRAA